MLLAKLKFTFGLLLIPIISFSQFNIQNHEIEWMFDSELSLGDTILNSSSSSIENHFVFENLSSDTFHLGSKYSFFDCAFNKNIYGVKNDEYSFRLNPIFSIQKGSDSYVSTRRGGYARGTLGKKFSWVTSFYENYQSPL